MELRIDWNRGGFWRVLDGENRDLGHFQQVNLNTPARLELHHENHGWLVVSGRLVDHGDGTATVLAD